jgi:NADH-quinone oxidoreductase subunit E
MTAEIPDPAKRARGSNAPETVARILAGNDGEHGALIAVLEGIQSEYGYLPEEALRALADQTGRSLVDIYAVATFYRSFSLSPRGRHVICVCLGTACHVRGAPMVVGEFERRLGVKAGETTPDGEFTLETVNCLGACALGPIVVVDGHYFSNVDPARVKGILKDIRTGLARVSEAAEAVPAK